MRRINAFLTAGIMILFVLHLFWGVFIMLGLTEGSNPVFSFLSYLMIALCVLHTLSGCKLTFDTFRAIRRAGVSYPGQNRIFWIRRISGFSLILFMAIHVWLFRGETTDGVFRLRHFDIPALISQLLMVTALAVHLLTNIRPLKIAFGIEDGKNYKTDVLIILSAALLLAAIGFVLYLLRWKAL